MELNGQRHAQATLPPGNEIWYPLYRMLGGSQGVWTGKVNLAPTGL